MIEFYILTKTSPKTSLNKKYNKAFRETQTEQKITFPSNTNCFIIKNTV